MDRWTLLRNQWLLFVTYGGAAWLSVYLTRFDGGVAFLWGASAILIAALMKTATRNWWAPLLVCGAVGATITTRWGLGGALALPLMVMNLSEAMVSTWLVRRWAKPGEPLHSLGWLGSFIGAAGIAGPVCAALIACTIFATEGRDALQAFVHVFTGHSLGNLTFAPLALLFTGRRARRDSWIALRKRAADVAIVLPMTFLVSGFVFWQSDYPLLFWPISMIIVATFRIGRVGAAAAIFVVALTGGLLTALGHGPAQLVAASFGARMLFFQFYLAITVLTVLPITADLHSRRQILRRVRISEARFRMITQHSADILMHLTVDGQIRYVSPAIERLAGYGPDALVGKHKGVLIAPEDHERIFAEHEATLAAGGETRTYQYRAVLADGSRRWFATHACAMIDEDGRIDGLLAVIRDVTDDKAREDRLQNAALTDALTGLPNRRALIAHVETFDPAAAQPTTLALLDLDHFKRINDTHGHDIGDAVLRQFAVVARTLLRKDDFLARLGGEEFVVVLRATRPEEALALCDRIRSQLGGGPVIVADLALSVTVSGGVAVLGRDGLDRTLKRADVALYDAKKAGRDQLRLAA